MRDGRIVSGKKSSQDSNNIMQKAGGIVERDAAGNCILEIVQEIA